MDNIFFFWWPDHHGGWHRGIILGRDNSSEFTHVVEYPPAFSTSPGRYPHSLEISTYGRRWLALASISPARDGQDVSELPAPLASVPVVPSARIRSPYGDRRDHSFFLMAQQSRLEYDGTRFAPRNIPLSGTRSWAINPLIADALCWNGMFPAEIMPRPASTRSDLVPNDPHDVSWDDLVDLLREALTRYRIGPTWLTIRMSNRAYWPAQLQEALLQIMEEQWVLNWGSRQEGERDIPSRFEDAATQWIIVGNGPSAPLRSNSGAHPESPHEPNDAVLAQLLELALSDGQAGDASTGNAEGVVIPGFVIPGAVQNEPHSDATNAALLRNYQSLCVKRRIRSP